MPPMGHEATLLIVSLLVCMSMQTIMAEYGNVPAPNDQYGNSDTLSIDGTVITKMASVGGDVELQAMTRGHTSEDHCHCRHSSNQRRTH